MSRNNRTRAQAAIFDGITLLLLASVSAAVIFSYVGQYGEQQDRVLRSAYTLNYMQSAVKASYYIDASTLSFVDDEEHGLNERGQPVHNTLEAYWDLKNADFVPGPEKGCKELKNYKGSFSVSELLKKDLAESIPAKLDDQFDGTAVMGSTAYKCALKELMKPFWYAGYYYGFDVVDETDGQIVGVAPSDSTHPLPNNRLITDYLPFLKNGAGSGGICGAARTISSDVVTVHVPFKVVYVNEAARKRDIRDLELAFCIWQPNPI